MSRKGDFRCFSSAAEVSELWPSAPTLSQHGEGQWEEREAFVVGNGFGHCGGADIYGTHFHQWI